MWLPRNAIQHELCRSHQGRVEPGGARTSQAPCYVDPDLRINGNEVFELATLLSAMGVTLEHPQVDGAEGELTFSQKAFESGPNGSELGRVRHGIRSSFDGF